MATLKASTRVGSGKGDARKLRATGNVPAVAYGQGSAARSLALKGQELNLLLASINAENTIIELQVEGERPIQALIREIQRHPSRSEILHVDLFEVQAGTKLHVNVPIRFNGTPVGVRDSGGILQEVLRDLSVECLPVDIPSEIELDVDGLELGDAIHVKDVTVPNATVLNDPDLVICMVTAPTVSATEADEAESGEAAEPAVAGEKSEESEAE